MNIKKAIKYQILENKKSIITFYSIMYLIFISIIITAKAFAGNESEGMISGTESASVIFIFVLSLNSFKENFKMFLQNGLSRKTLFVSFVFSSIIISIFMALVDSINGVVIGKFMTSQSMFEQLYSQRYIGNSSNMAQILEGFLWSIFLYTMIAMVGFFITTLYYRMNKTFRLTVSIGVPTLFFVILPFIDVKFANGAISRGITNFLAFASGFKNGFNPYYSMVTCILSFILFGGLGYLLVRRAVVKE